MLDADPVSVHRCEQGDYHLRWRHRQPGTRVTISVIDNPAEPGSAREVESVQGESARLPGLARDRRHLFHLRDELGHEALLAERTLPLEGSPNFRDLGGYQTEDGRRVKWGYLYRSGQLSRLSDLDRALLADVALDVVCDFRRQEEQERDPSLLPQPGPQLLSLSITPGSNASFFSQAGDSDAVDRQAMFDFMVDINRDFVLEQCDAYSRMFRALLAREDTRMLVHCAAGKDRTGFAAALLLLVLGVPRETVMQDYLLTAQYFIAEQQLQYLRDKYEMDLEAENLMPVLQVFPEYLQAALDTIDEEFDSVEDYLEQALGVEPEQQELLRRRYLY
jgi:protein-tyrosine phosphatase